MWGVLRAFRPRLPRAETVRRWGVRTLPVVAATTGGMGLLWSRKRGHPPDADFLGHRARFNCFARSALEGQGLLPSGAVVRQALVDVGADIESLRRTAKRLRGPVERDIAAAECLLLPSDAAPASPKEPDDRDTTPSHRAACALGPIADAVVGGEVGRRQLYRSLVEKWRAAGYLDEPVERRKAAAEDLGLNFVTQEDESYGRDVGCEAPLFWLADDCEVGNGLSAADWAAAADALDKHGVVLLRTFLPLSHVAQLRERLGIHASVLQRSKKSAVGTGPVREYNAAPLEEGEPDLEPVVSSVGRRHFYLRGRALEEAIRHVQAGAMPLVWEHLSHASGATLGRVPYISEVQMIVTDPNASDQFWHIDNCSQGLTLFVPLTPVSEDIGPTLFLPGSHHLFEGERTYGQRFRSCSSSLLESDGITAGVMSAGDALLYDSRILHRCGANRLYDRTRIALYFRYDFDRPPGFGITGTLLVTWCGRLLACFQRFYGALPSGVGGGGPKPVSAARGVSAS